MSDQKCKETELAEQIVNLIFDKEDLCFEGVDEDECKVTAIDEVEIILLNHEHELAKANWANDSYLAQFHKEECELMSCGHMRKYFVPGLHAPSYCMECKLEEQKKDLQKIKLVFNNDDQVLTDTTYIEEMETILDKY